MSSNPGVEIKGGMFTFMSLKLHTSDMSLIDTSLAQKVQQAPAFFKDTPVVVDLSILESLSDSSLNITAILNCIRSHRLQPIVASTIDKSSEIALSTGLPLIEASSRTDSETTTPNQTDKQAANTEKSPEIQPQSQGADPEIPISKEIEYIARAPLLIDKPVRSGQQIYARDTDLIIMGPVGHGAEVLADNNIHIYGPLRGRALCGISGNTETRIFCSSLEAELVSVAGNFRMLETIPEELRGKPAQVSFSQDKLNIEPL